MRCESPTNSPAGVAAMADIVATHARALGLRVDVTPLGERTGPLLYATNRAEGDTRPGILVLAHLDTVHPIGTLDDNPIRIEGDKLYGPGGYDMKAGIYLVLSAMTGLAEPGATRLPIDFLMVPDEETGSHASRQHIERFARNARYGLVCEPARANGGKCVTARKGTGMLRLGVKGRPAHAGVQHQLGRSAIREMAHQVLALEAMTDYERGVTVSVGTISGGTATNTVPAQCRCVVDFRVPDMGAAEDVLRRMRQLCAVGPDVELDIDVELNRPPMVKDAAVTALLELARGYAREAGFVLDDAPMTGGGSDANFTSAMGVPTLDGLGADGDGAHTLHEHILISTLEMRVKFWSLLLRELA
ncbi:peptidase [Bordetella genomosp. 13]|uniref:Peptidase n=2 Tax=Bordetella genomosp. 13 TaxID=463040 RepID=A0A1W6ZKB0_9BORD|nr:peptidase [Bordetella genomosp. 13]